MPRKKPQPDRVGEKRCSRCRRSLPVREFGSDKARADGLSPYCRGCVKARKRGQPARAELGPPRVLVQTLKTTSAPPIEATPGGGPPPPGLPASSPPPRAPLIGEPALPPELTPEGAWRPFAEAPRAPLPPAPPRTGPKSKLTPELIDGLYQALCKGVTRKAACSVVEVDPATVRKWLSEADRSEATPLHLELKAAVAQGESVGMHALELVVRGEAQLDGATALRFLERRFPEEWAKREALAVDLHGPPVEEGALRELLTTRLLGLLLPPAAPADAPGPGGAPGPGAGAGDPAPPAAAAP